MGELTAHFGWKRIRLDANDGKPHMCTYGMDSGRDEPPRGPAGVVIDPQFGNVETDFTMFMIRNTLWEVLKRVNITNDAIGPVEYSMESYSCRFVCVVVFMIGTLREILEIMHVVQFLYRSKNVFQPWVGFDDFGGDEKLKKIALRKHSTELNASDDPTDIAWRVARQAANRTCIDLIKFKANGMPLTFKIFWVIPCLVLARAAILLMLSFEGVAMLMESGSITDMILNSLALLFVLELDELLFGIFARERTKLMLNKLEPFRLPAKAENVENLVNKINSELEQSSSYSWRNLLDFCKKVVYFNRMLIIALTLVICAHVMYYCWYCSRHPVPLPPPEPYFTNPSPVSITWWKSWFGDWRSKPLMESTPTWLWLVNGPSNVSTCMPYAGHGTVARGCGLPDGWQAPES